MPLPKQKPGEDKAAFVGRCMSDPKMVAEFPGRRQRLAVCFNSSSAEPKAGAEVAKSEKSEPAAKSMAVKLVKVAEGDEKRTVFGVVLEPEEFDSHRDIYSADEVEKTAWNFMESHQNFGLMHKQIMKEIVPLESYLAPVDFELNGTKIKKGTWLLRVKVKSDQIWKDVKSGKLTGFSIGGMATRVPELTWS